MGLPPLTTPNPGHSPFTIFNPHLPMSSATSATTRAPQPSAISLPLRSKDSEPSHGEKNKMGGGGDGHEHDGDASKDHFPLPKLRLEVRDLNHRGATAFLDAVSAGTSLEGAVTSVLRLLYTSPRDPFTHAPPTRSVTLVLRAMPGVAYTTGSDLDSDHKEIHFSLNYIAGIPKDRRTDEITGVLTHEMVHCYQWNAHGSCPGGLIEGIADWVRLGCGLSPPHWKREASGKWDAGYQHTAYFLEYLEGRFGEGTVRRINEKLRLHKYEEKPFWTELLGRPVEQLWGDYVEKLKDDEAVLVSKDDISDEDVRRAGETASEPKA
ncbi:plant basic secretory protein [Plectosphaerella cucumerina]|uniref:Plant basic secretory protein n=1 Tax=Plectosphaerella cucumerina TaxID=40658 RepID=A0A8K0TRM6_9PEZI|nr:plant basic secretory protein [Plectosphaerella cucumerina]